MKKLFVIFLVILYSISSIGATLYTHKCGVKSIKTSFKNIKDARCSLCKAKKTKPLSCCKSQKKVIKISEPHHSAKKNTSVKKAEYSFIIPSFIRKLLLINNNLFKNIFFFKNPPKKKVRKINILNCVYRN